MDSISALLEQAKIGPSGRVGLALEHGPELAVWLVGIMNCAVAVPVDPRLTGAELTDLHAQLQFDALVTTGKAPALPGWKTRRDFTHPHAGSVTVFFYPSRVQAGNTQGIDGIAEILRTSGTTGQSKMVPITHENILARVAKLQKWLRLTQEDRSLCIAKLHYSYGSEVSLYAPLSVGGSASFLPATADGGLPDSARKWLGVLRPTYIAAGPTFHMALLEQVNAQGGPPQHGLRMLQTGGMPISEGTSRELEEVFGAPVLDAYGLSETGQLSSGSPCAEGNPFGTLGRPDPAEVAVFGEDGTALPRGCTGEIVVRGPGVSPGYLDASGIVLSALVDGWFHTGDLGAIDGEGYLRLSGRLKDMINRGGEKIAPAEIEQVLLQHPDVTEAAAFALPHSRLGEDVGAVVVLKPEAKVSAIDLRNFVANRLIPFKVPRRIHLVDVLPKAETGKLSRPLLTKLFARPDSKTRVAPRTGLEHEIISIWQRLLDQEDVDPSDDFFEIGGESLLAARMKLELEAHVGHELPNTLLFEASTPRQLADAIIAADSKKADLLVPIKKEGRHAPFIFFDGDFNGGGYYLRHVAANLDAEQPLWSFRPFDPTKGTLPAYEDMAREYLQLLRQAGLKPPYLFGGHCNGALMALAVAQQAEAAGDKVSTIVLIDPISFNAKFAVRLLGRMLRALSFLISRDPAARQSWFESAMTRLWQTVDAPELKLRNVWRIWRATREAGVSPFDLRMSSYYTAMAGFLPSRTSARLVCLTPEGSLSIRAFANRHWRRFGSSFEAVTVKGQHLSCVTEGVKDLTAKLGNAIAARPRSPLAQ
jgi:acyl-CoA synthetase (AMP-forming)/AMP-acid ligase II/thioesterase domain-containing protein/acyl carrier protein